MVVLIQIHPALVRALIGRSAPGGRVWAPLCIQTSHLNTQERVGDLEQAAIV
jgi:hypothetical protein